VIRACPSTYNQINPWIGCSRMIFYVTVCGNERLALALDKDPYYLLKGDGTTFTLNIDHWFKEDYDPTTITPIPLNLK
jgi:hypothetical protein